jgi:hypothetical protein
MVASFDPQGKLERLFFAGGPKVEIDGETYRAAPRASGRVTKVDLVMGQITVNLDDERESFLVAPDSASLVGRVVRFASPAGSTAHTVQAAKLTRDGLILTPKDDLIVGQMRVDEVKGKVLHTLARLVFAPSYPGATALDASCQPIGLVAKAEQDRIELVAPPEGGKALVGTDVWLSSVGPGDRLEAPSVFAWQRAR